MADRDIQARRPGRSIKSLRKTSRHWSLASRNWKDPFPGFLRGQRRHCQIWQAAPEVARALDGYAMLLAKAGQHEEANKIEQHSRAIKELASPKPKC